jgi:hypothetical protein
VPIVLADFVDEPAAGLLGAPLPLGPCKIAEATFSASRSDLPSSDRHPVAVEPHGDGRRYVVTTLR